MIAPDSRLVGAINLAQAACAEALAQFKQVGCKYDRWLDRVFWQRILAE